MSNRAAGLRLGKQRKHGLQAGLRSDQYEPVHEEGTRFEQKALELADEPGAMGRRYGVSRLRVKPEVRSYGSLAPSPDGGELEFKASGSRASEESEKSPFKARRNSGGVEDSLAACGELIDRCGGAQLVAALAPG